MTIAFVKFTDGGNNGGTSNNWSAAFNYTGNLLVVQVNIGNLAPPSVRTYNGVVLQGPFCNDTGFGTFMYFLVGHSAGSANISLTTSDMSTQYVAWVAADYSGFDLTIPQPDSSLETSDLSNTHTSFSDSFTAARQPVWMVAGVAGSDLTTAVSGGFTGRGSAANAYRAIADTNGLVTGATTLTTSTATNNTFVHQFLAFDVTRCQSFIPLLGVGCGIALAKKIEENPIIRRRELILPIGR